ncbi:peptidase family S58-domain-containing protein [Plectosphaerella plurivora]|uniref:Peptidase family S58-domain-containing protein n=1 Tax=Plectosphaerella plurivora TaxID=936078 RepID=A0A9P9AB20_9PEZI|nr:peptidase family S58-domain-containing protein [Plectosphaerella plurivora]
MAHPCPDPYPALTGTDRDELYTHVQLHYKRFGWKVVKVRTSTRPTGDVYRVTLGCDCGGRARESISRGIRQRKSRKTGCQWTSDLMRAGDEWTYVPGRFVHNHPPPLKVEPSKDSIRARAEAQARKRAAERGRVRDVLPTMHLGLYRPGPKNSLTDVPGVLVSVQSTQPSPSVNTGVTVILPRREWLTEACHANIFRFNGAGEVTGSHWVQETGLLNSPIVLTNSMSVGDAYRGVLDWAIAHHAKDGQLDSFLMPVVAETYDGYLNDICKMLIKPQDITRGIDLCSDAPVPEGNTGGGTGMVCHHWKGGTGSASRVLPGQELAPTPAPLLESPVNTVPPQTPTYTVGVLVQANYGKAEHLRIGGAPVGRILHDQNAHERIVQQKAEAARHEAEERALREQRRQQQYEEQLRAQTGQQPLLGIDQAFAQAGQLANQLQQAAFQRQSRQSSASDDAQAQAQLRWQASVATHKQRKDGSIIVVLATDAPLNPTQCERLAKRATVGFSRVGGVGHNLSGDIFIAFSTGNSIPVASVARPDGASQADSLRPRARTLAAVDDATLDGLFEAAADATEEAIYNALFMAQSIEGFKERKVEAIPLKWVKEIMEKYL